MSTNMTFIKTFIARTVLIATAALGGHACAQAEPSGTPQQLPSVSLGVSFYNIKAELAQTERQREIGLMFRKNLGLNDGMIFVFERAGTQCFWMKNTLIPLSVAFIDDSGTIVNIDEMKAETEDPHCSVKPVRYVLEMNKGWFSKRGIKEGSKISGELFGSPH
ncbi:MAG: DUF192 domain-containing protein [Burkholderiales bacterium]|nr:DUF192 domain-containing protein [Burkholderiales bacterium]MDE2432186.1 DUF192 domain-containing protein [Burkholderiales bacterium]HET8694589.1 DUF192 domain-containing protein [Aquabacterium sp.]